MIKVHGVILSPFVRKVLAITKIKKLPYENIAAFPGTKTREFLSLSPLGKIPALEDGDFSISDSTAICEYLDDKYPETPTRPASPEDRATARWLEEYGDTKLTELCVAGIYFERFVKKAFGKGDSDEAKVANTIEKLLPPQLNYLESILPAEGFLFDAISAADISIVGPFVSASYVGYTPDEEQLPKLTAYINRVKSHEAVAEVLKAERELFNKIT